MLEPIVWEEGESLQYLHIIIKHLLLTIWYPSFSLGTWIYSSPTPYWWYSLFLSFKCMEKCSSYDFLENGINFILIYSMGWHQYILLSKHTCIHFWLINFSNKPNDNHFLLWLVFLCTDLFLFFSHSTPYKILARINYYVPINL